MSLTILLPFPSSYIQLNIEVDLIVGYNEFLNTYISRSMSAGIHGLKLVTGYDCGIGIYDFV